MRNPPASEHLIHCIEQELMAVRLQHTCRYYLWLREGLQLAVDGGRLSKTLIGSIQLWRLDSITHAVTLPMQCSRFAQIHLAEMKTTWLLVRQEVFDLWHSDRKQTRIYPDI